jgi:hypothetical protein
VTVAPAHLSRAGHRRGSSRRPATQRAEAGRGAGEWAAGVGGTEKRLGLLSEFCIVRLAQQVAALHLALPGPLHDRQDLSPVLLAAVALGMVAMDAWLLNKLAAFDGEAEDLEAEESV